MSNQLAKWAKGPRGEKPKPDRAKEDKLSPDEDRALKTLQKEARAAGSRLQTGGKGGLSPSTVLGVMRKAGYKCKACGRLGDADNGGLSIHHKSEHLENPKAKARSVLLRSQGLKDSTSNVVPICAECHDKIHEKDRAEFGDAEQRANPEKRG